MPSDEPKPFSGEPEGDLLRTDADGVVVEASPGLCRRLGVLPGDLLGRRASEVLKVWPGGASNEDDVAAALQRSQRTLLTLLSNLPGLVYRCANDPRWTMEFISDGCLPLTGYPSEALIGNRDLSFADLIVPEDRQKVWDDIEAAINEHRPFHLSYRITTAAGDERWVEEHGRAVFDADGRALALEGFISDTTAWHQAESRTQHLNAVLRAVRNVNQLVARVDDRDELLRQVCEALAETRGYESAAVALREGDQWRMYGGGRGTPETVSSDQLPPCVLPALERDSMMLACQGAEAEPGGAPAQPEGRVAGRIEHGGVVYGVLLVSAGSGHSVDAEEMVLLGELTEDLAHALHSLDTERRRRQAETALRSASDAMRAFMDASPLATMAVDSDGRVTVWNAAAERLLGWSTEEVVGGPLPHVPGCQSTLIADALAGTPVSGVEIVRRTRDGREILVSVSTSPVVSLDGTVMGAIAVLTDVTRRQETEQALRESEKRFREMADLLPDMLLELDSRLRITYTNRATREVLQVTPEQLEQGISLLELLVEGDQPAVAWRIAEMQADSTPVVGELLLRRGEGQVLPVEAHAAPLVGADGQVTGVRAVLRDMSERRVAEQNQRLAAVGQLAAGVAHEFNNLLAAMSGRAQLAEVVESKDAYDQLVSTVLVASVRGADIARKLMDFAQPPEPRREPIAIEQSLDAALAVTAKEITLAGIEVHTDYATEGERVFADRIQLQHVFVNLILNACHVMPTGGDLWLTTRHEVQGGDDGQIVVLVRDNGPGVSEANLRRLFEPFFTVQGTKGRRAVRGAGLGLAVSHGIVRAHGGTIVARSEEGHGTEFELRLRVHRNIIPEDAQKTEEVAPPLVTRDRSVLVVEDEPDVLDIVARFLGKHGFHAVMAQSTAEALAVLGVARFDVVVTDLMMPGGGGREVLSVVRRMPDPPPVVVITGMPVQALDDRVLELGADAYLQKPFRLTDMLSTLNTVLAEAEWLRPSPGSADDETRST